MEIDKKSGEFKVSSTEPFGKLLIELMYSRPLDESIHETQKRIGEILLSSYIGDRLQYTDDFGIETEKTLIHEDISRDISEKAQIHAKNSSIEMSFNKDYYDGLEKIAAREVKDLDDLYAERAIVTIAFENGITSQDGILVDEQDLELIEEEIEQAEAAKQALEMINKHKKE